ncbi:UDP-glucuronosyltransferase 1-3 [Blattella germanica]|nr:UDP-glucuronosyltransferase 1-3 [Blattella germanica]
MSMIPILQLILLLSWNAASYRILGIFPHVGQSHASMTKAIMTGLASRGHQVVVMSHFPLKYPHHNYTDISLVGSDKIAVEETPLLNVGTGDVMFSFKMLAELGIDMCEKTLSFPPVQNLIKSKERFDLLIIELFNTDCMLGFVHKFKVPFIAVGTSVMMPWGNSRFGNPDNPSFIPHHFLGHSDRMDFGQRFWNSFFQVTLQWGYHSYMNVPTERIARKYFGDDLPPLADIARNTSLLLLNTHFSMNQPRPFVPNIVEIGGIHLSPPKELPTDLKEFLDGAKDGAICFSLGSLVKMDTLPVEKREAFLQAFAELPQRVLWKLETDVIPNRPANVKVVRWLPQLDILRHPNVKAFVTHGGLMGTTEAVHSGVPMVAIPLFGDQMVNVASYVSEGFAIKLAFADITKESVLNALKAVLYDSSYKENAIRISRAFNDRPMSAQDTAIYWTEYVIRHKGAEHLRSAAIDLAWYQYLLLDVIVVFLLAVLILIFVTVQILKFIIGLCKSRGSVNKKKRQ